MFWKTSFSLYQNDQQILKKIELRISQVDVSQNVEVLEGWKSCGRPVRFTYTTPATCTAKKENKKIQ